MLTWPEGNAWLTQRLAEPLAGRIRTGHVVLNVEPTGGRVAVDAWDARNHRAVRLLAREVVLACPVLVAARIYRPWRERRPAFVGAFRYAPWLVANLHLDRRPRAGRGRDGARRTGPPGPRRSRRILPLRGRVRVGHAGRRPRARTAATIFLTAHPGAP